MALRSVRRHVQQDREALHYMHEQRLANATPAIDDALPKSHARAGRVDSKAIINKFIRAGTIVKENERLSDALTKIYSRNKVAQLDHWYDPQLDRMRRHTQACYDHRRNLRAQKTKRENELLVARLNQTPASVGVREWQRTYEERLQKLARLHTRFKLKESYSEYVKRRQRVQQTLLDKHEQTAAQRRSEQLQWVMDYQRELAEQLDPNTQGKWIEQLLSGPLRSMPGQESRSNSPHRQGRSRTRQNEALQKSSGSRPKSAGFGYEEQYFRDGGSVAFFEGAADSDSGGDASLKKKLNRAASAGPLRRTGSAKPHQQWDPSVVRPESRSRSPGLRGMERPPSRSPDKRWQSEHYIAASKGIHYQPSPEELHARRREASTEVIAKLKFNRVDSAQKEPRPTSADLYVFSGIDTRSMSPSARARLREEAAQAETEMKRPGGVANARRDANRRERGAGGGRAGGSRKKSSPLDHSDRPLSASLGRPSRELQSIVDASTREVRAFRLQQRRQQEQEEKENDALEEAERERQILKARQQVFEAAQRQSNTEQLHSSSGLHLGERLVDEDLDAPEIAPPSRPWSSPVPLPPLKMVLAKEKEAAIPDDGVMPHAQADSAEDDGADGDGAGGEEEKWRGRLDWEEANQEVQTPHAREVEELERQREEAVQRAFRKKRHPRRPSLSRSDSVGSSVADGFHGVDPADDFREHIPDTAYLSTNISVHDLKLLLGVPLDKAETPFASPSATPQSRRSEYSASSYANSRANSRPTSAMHARGPSGGHSRVGSRPTSAMFVTGPTHVMTSSYSASSLHSAAAVGGASRPQSRPTSAMHYSGPSGVGLGATEAQRFLTGSSSVQTLSQAAYSREPVRQRSPLRAAPRHSPAGALTRQLSAKQFGTYAKPIVADSPTAQKKMRTRPEWFDRFGAGGRT